MASGRVTRRFLFRTSFLSLVHLWVQSRGLSPVTGGRGTSVRGGAGRAEAGARLGKERAL